MLAYKSKRKEIGNIILFIKIGVVKQYEPVEHPEKIFIQPIKTRKI